MGIIGLGMHFPGLGGVMRRCIFIVILELFIACHIYSEKAPALSFLGFNGYPSDGKIPYLIDIFTFDDGMISRVSAYTGDPATKSVETHVSISESGILGIDQFDRYEKKFEIRQTKIGLTLVLQGLNLITRERTENVSDIIFSVKSNFPFEDQSRSFALDSKNQLIISDKKSGDIIYVFSDSQIISEGYFKSEWKSVGDRIYTRSFLTMEKYGDWINAGRGVFTGPGLKTDDPRINIINYCILNIVYPNIPDFIPFIFGLKLGRF
jgi:hypothetical protein